MKCSLIAFLSFILFYSCTSRAGGQATNTNTQDSTAQETAAITQSTHSFYDWCFKNDFPYYEIVRGHNGKCRLDTAAYFAKFRAPGTISELFIAKEKERVKGCAQFMATVDYASYEAADAYEFDSQCADFYYMYWIKSQEIPDSFSIKNVIQSGYKDASADVYVKYGGPDEYLATVRLKKEQGSWKITDITSKTQNNDEPTGTSAATKSLIEDFIPAGWKTILHESGDLNNDGIDDHVIVIENTIPENRKLNDRLGQDTLNLNPRAIMVFFKDKNGYILVEQNHNGFIPTENDEESTCLADPLMTEGGISIQKGILTISFQYWLSCGSWSVNNADYKFRYQDQEMKLIGFDHSEFHRASGEQSSTSINLSTARIETITGENMFDDNISKPKKAKSKWKGTKHYTLGTCDTETYFELLDIK